MAINKRQLKKQLQKMKDMLVFSDADDWCDEINEADEIFIKCLIHSLAEYDREELRELFKEESIHNFNDLCCHYAEELGITGGVEDIE